MTHVEYGATCAASADAGAFEAHVAELVGLIAPLFSRRDLRANAVAYVQGLLCPEVSGNCWAIAQAAGHDRPYRLQHLLSGAVWDEDAVRDQVRGFVAGHLGDGGVLIFDETGDLKKGTATAGVGRQYTGTAGRIENAIDAADGYAHPNRPDRQEVAAADGQERGAGAGFEWSHALR